jgi:hypothetical protein
MSKRIIIPMENNECYVQRLEPISATEDPLLNHEKVIIKQYHDNAELIKENERLKEALKEMIEEYESCVDSNYDGTSLWGELMEVAEKNRKLLEPNND